MSGLFNSEPPVAEKSPGVIAVESALKKMWRGPSELKYSIKFAEVNGSGNGPSGVGVPADVAAGVAATV